MHVLVMVKSPEPGRVKTRLCPPCTLAEAAEVAAALIADTLVAVVACGAARRILALDGPPGEWIPPGFDVVAQSPGDFAARLGAAWTYAGGPGIQIGMDTPQVSSGLLDEALASLEHTMSRSRRVALLGPALDGGWWAIGLSQADPEVFTGVPMSTAETCARQRARLTELGWSVGLLSPLRDVDEIDDLVAVAATIPGSATAQMVERLAVRHGRRLDG